jgi:hypothetical protein
MSTYIFYTLLDMPLRTVSFIFYFKCFFLKTKKTESIVETTLGFFVLSLDVYANVCFILSRNH